MLMEFSKEKASIDRMRKEKARQAILDNKEDVDSNQLINNKITLLEHLTKKEVNAEDVKKDIIQEFKDYDKDTRILTYKVLLEKFNSKYDGLSEDQKTVLKEFINSVDSTPGLRNFYNTKKETR